MKLKYLPVLDGLRGCAFTLVFLAHAGLEKVVPGGLGVTIFFFLSGYLITTLLRKEWAETGHVSLRAFYLRRAYRILPPLYLALLVGWILDAAHVPTHQASWGGLLSVLFYFYNYAALIHPLHDGMPAGLSVVWSLMIEEHFYLLFPFVYLLWLKRRMSPRTIVTILVWVCAAVLLWRCVLVYVLHTSLDSLFSWTYAATDARFDSILWGCILAIGANPWCGDRNSFLERYCGKLALGSLGLFLLTLVIREPHFRQTLRYTLQGMALIPLFYYIVSNAERWQTTWLAWRPLRWIGWVSYTMYLFHFLVLQILHAYLRWNGVVLGFCAAILSGVIGEGVRRLIETPLRRMKKRQHLEVAVNN
jgi:peptidoglycan/LPS O-acetylase OafA/YrhL